MLSTVTGGSIGSSRRDSLADGLRDAYRAVGGAYHHREVSAGVLLQGDEDLGRHLIVEDEGARVPSVTSRRPGKTIGLERRGMILARLTRSSRQFGRLNTYRALPFLG